MLAFLLTAALLIGVSLGVLGGGGSVLAVPVLVYGAGFPAREAIASSLVVVGFSSLLGALSRWRSIARGAAFSYAAWGMTGTYAGARLAAYLSDAAQMVLFSVTIVAVAALMLRSTPARAPRSLILPALFGGVLTGLVGVGGGFLIVPTLVLAGGLEMPQAVPTSLLVIALNSAAGLAGYAGETTLRPAFLALFTSTVLVGLLAGARLLRSLRPARLRKGFAIFLMAVGLVTLVQNL